MTYSTFLVRAASHFFLAFLIMVAGLFSTDNATAAGGFTCDDGSVVADPFLCPKPRTVLVITAQGSYLAVMTSEMIKMFQSMPGYRLIVGNEYDNYNTGIPGYGAAPGTNRVAISGQTGAAAAAGGTPLWHAWTAYSISNVGSSFQPQQFNGDANVFLGGVDYKLNNDMLLGVAISDERIRVATPYNGGTISGNGNTIAPYFSWRFNRNLAADFSVAMGTMNVNMVDNSGARITGDNKANRTSYTASLSYGKVIDKWRFAAQGGLVTMEDKFSSFTLSNRTFVAGSTARTSQARLGGEAMYSFGALVPFAGVTYIYDLERPFVTTSGQNGANDRDAWQVRLGLNIRSTGPFYGGVQLSSELGRSQMKNEQILFNVGMRF